MQISPGGMTQSRDASHPGGSLGVVRFVPPGGSLRSSCMDVNGLGGDGLLQGIPNASVEIRLIEVRTVRWGCFGWRRRPRTLATPSGAVGHPLGVRGRPHACVTAGAAWDLERPGRANGSADRPSVPGCALWSDRRSSTSFSTKMRVLTLWLSEDEQRVSELLSELLK
jgi:hypothetical protein